MTTTSTGSNSSSTTAVVVVEEDEVDLDLDRAAMVVLLAAALTENSGSLEATTTPRLHLVLPALPGLLDPLGLLVPTPILTSPAISEDEVTTMTSVTGSGSSPPATIDNNDTYILMIVRRMISTSP